MSQEMLTFVIGCNHASHCGSFGMRFHLYTNVKARRLYMELHDTFHDNCYVFEYQLHIQVLVDVLTTTNDFCFCQRTT